MNGVNVLRWALDAGDQLVLTFPFWGESSQSRSVLLVRLDGIGDFVLWLGAAQTLSEHYRKQGYQVHLAVNEPCAALARMVPFWDVVIPIDRRRFITDVFYRWGQLRRIHGWRYHEVFQAQLSREFFYGDALVRASEAPRRIGPVGDTVNCSAPQKLRADRFYTQLLNTATIDSHELLRSADLVHAFTATRPSAGVFDLRPYLEGISGGNYFLVAPGAGWSARRWPLHRFAALIGEMTAQTGWHPLICGAAGEERICQELAQQLRVPSTVHCGSSLMSFVRQIAGARMVFSNDSSAGHIAAACRVPAVVILGGGHYGRFFPYPPECGDSTVMVESVFRLLACFRCNWNCCYPRKADDEVPCISNVSVEDVLRGVHNLRQRLG